MRPSFDDDDDDAGKRDGMTFVCAASEERDHTPQFTNDN